MFDNSLPVSGLTFAEAAIYCNRFSQAHGYEGFYIIHDDTIAFNPLGRGYRLPTQYEWAYAARDRRDKAYKYASDAEDPVFINKISALLRKY